MFTSINVECIFDSASLLPSLGDKGLFSSANILQVGDVARRVIFLLLLLCFQPIVRLFLPRETNEMFRTFFSHYKNNSTSSQVFSVNCSIIQQFCCTADVIFHTLQKFFQIWSTIAGDYELCVGFQQITFDKEAFLPD